MSDDQNQFPENLPRRRANPPVPPIEEHLEPSVLDAAEGTPRFAELELAKVRAQTSRDRMVAGLTGLVILGAGTFVVMGDLDAGTFLGYFAGVLTGGYFLPRPPKR